MTLPAVPLWHLRVDTGPPPGRPFPALRRRPGDHASRGSSLTPIPPADPRGWRGGKPGRGGEPEQLQPPSHRLPAAARGGNFCRAGSGQGPRRRPPASGGAGKHRGAGRVPGRERGKPCSGTEPRHGAEEGGESPLFFLGAEYCANSGKWDFSPPAPVQRGEGLDGRRGERRLTKRGTLRGGRKPAGA